MDAVVPSLITRIDAAAPGHLVRVVGLSGFGLRDDADGAIVDGEDVAGVVLGGLCNDAILAEAASLDLTSRVAMTTRVTDAAADAAGMVCGGTAHLLLTPVSDLPKKLSELLQQATPLAIVTPADGSGDELVVTKKSAITSASDDLGESADHAATIELGRAALQGGRTTSVVEKVGSVEYLINTIVPSTRVIIAGSGPMADAIKTQGELMGWTVDVNEDVAAGVGFLAGAGPADGLIILSHDRAVDVPLLDAALNSSVGYIGGMGSRGTQTARRNALTELGHTDQSRINGPIGLDLGSRNPAETAVAIAAEFLANRAGRDPGRLTDSSGPING